MSVKIIRRIYEEVAELEEYVIRNKKNIKKLKEEYEKAVDINERFTDRIKAMKKEVFDLERGMCDIREVRETSCHNDEEFAINTTYSYHRKGQIVSDILIYFQFSVGF